MKDLLLHWIFIISTPPIEREADIMKAERGLLKGSIISVVTALTILFSAALSFGATFCVDSATELQSALTTASSNGEDDIVQIVQGTYSGNFAYASTEAYGVSVEGGYASGCASREVDPDNTVLDGNATGSVLVLSSPDQAVEFVVDGLTIQNGKTSGSGGGLFTLTGSGEVTLTNNIVSGNVAGTSGGGVYANGSTVTLTNNTITENSGDGVYANGSTVTLTNNTITENSGGYGSGGGVYVYASTTAILANNTITGNSSGVNSSGGGVNANGSTVILTKNIITGNSAVYSSGGGVYANGSTVTLTNNTITENSGGWLYGGGVYVYGSTTATLTNNTITGNSAGIYGGGVYANGPTVILSKNTITGNSAGVYGGGVYASYSTTVTLTNNTITKNSTGSSGGGVYVYRPTTVTLTNNTISENSAEADSGGVYIWLYGNSDTARIYNNIIFNNKADTDGYDLYIINDGDDDLLASPVNLYNNDFDQSAAGTYIQIPFSIDASNLDNEDPLFVGDDNYHLIADSPCINAGDNDAPDLPDTDKDGNPRITGGIVDMGAYEYDPSTPTADAGFDQIVESGATVTLDGSGSYDPEGNPLTYLWTHIGITVTLSNANAIKPTFTAPPGVTSLTFKLEVTNETGLKSADEVTVTVKSGEALKPVYRFYSPVSQTHFWTISEEEKDYIIANYSSVMSYEGIAWYAYDPSEYPADTLPVYRFYSPTSGSHFYTMSEEEKDYIIANYSAVLSYEGIAWYAYETSNHPEDTLPVYRFYSPLNGSHFYTISEEEKDYIIANYSAVLSYEGIAWYAYEFAK